MPFVVGVVLAGLVRGDAAFAVVVAAVVCFIDDVVVVSVSVRAPRCIVVVVVPV